MILSCNNITKSFITDLLFSNISFVINENEKVGLVGINGAGKSTLLKIIIGDLTADSGEIILSSDTSIGYLAQNAMLASERTLYDEILTTKETLIKMEQELFKMENEMAFFRDDTEGFKEFSEKYAAFRNDFELKGGYSYRSHIKGILKGLGFSEEEFDNPVSILSGGQKTRLALAKILASQPELLLLDEPTNHLDISAVEWLEAFLSQYKGALIIVSHDRFFLDKTTSRTIELEGTKCTSYNGNYSFFSHHKEINREIEEKHYVNQQKEIKKQEEVIKQLRSFNREKSVKRAMSREKALSKIEQLDKPLYLKDKMTFSLSPRIESGNDVLFARDLKKQFDDKLLFSNINFEIFKGDKIALIGPNGCGKSTLLKIITENIEKTEGNIKLGANVQIGYYDQEHSLLNLDNNLIEEISDAYPNMTEGEIRNVLAAFLFTKDDVFKKILSLSGGEKGRLTLVKLMLSKANFLILDEPTNHLDLISKEILENNLRGYTGTLLFVSHDRYFINQVANKIFDLAQSKIEIYPGNYDYYLEKKKQNVQALSNKNEPELSQNKAQWLQRKEEQANQRKKEKLLEKTEQMIHDIEEKISKIDILMCESEIYTNHLKVQELAQEKHDFELELNELYEQWNLIVEE